MNTISKLAAALAVSSVVALAQSEEVSQAETQTGGLISKKYVAASYSYLDINHSGVDQFGASVVANVPVSSLVDIQTSFTHQWLEASSGDNAQTLFVDAVSYLAEGNAKPFVNAGIGYLWTENNQAEGLRYNVGAGVEYSLGAKASVTASAQFTDGFRRRTQSNQEFSGNVSLNVWATKDLVLGLGVSYLEMGDIGYSIGAGYRF